MEIYSTDNFILESHERPEIDRLESGHVKISPKKQIVDRTEFTPRQAIELMRLTIISGEAMKLAMQEIGINIGRINYQENGNWKSSLHIHLYCRADNAKIQQYGEPITPGHNEDFQPLNSKDIQRVQTALSGLLLQEKFSDQV